MMSDHPISIPRSQSSLVLLTRNFVSLMRSRKTGIIDIKNAAEILSVQKRRIYDITNVLEGIGLIAKVDQTSHVQWRGKESPLCEDYANVVNDLVTKRRALKEEEEELDRHLKYARKNLNHLLNDPKNKSYAYITRDDIVNSFLDCALITLKSNGLKIFKKGRSLRIKLNAGRMVDARLVTQQGICNTRELSELQSNKNKQLTNAELKNEYQTDEGTIIGQTEKEVARVILKSYKSEHSLRSQDSNSSNEGPFIQIEIPNDDYCFALQKGEGVCDLYDIN